jgi:protein-S-isoprenylcysteine O-methyltransferase Ste14
MATLEVLAALLLYGAFHSLTASFAWKARATRLLGERAFHGLYRLSYSIVSVLTLLPVLQLMATRPGAIVWSSPQMAAGVLLTLRAVAGIGLALALLQIDVLRFLGVKDAIAYISGRPLPLPAERLAKAGVYRLVRHPLYLFSLVGLWSSPIMTESALGFALGATVYFALGSILEEGWCVRSARITWRIARRSLADSAGEAWDEVRRKRLAPP